MAPRGAAAVVSGLARDVAAVTDRFLQCPCGCSCSPPSGSAAATPGVALAHLLA